MCFSPPPKVHCANLRPHWWVGWCWHQYLSGLLQAWFNDSSEPQTSCTTPQKPTWKRGLNGALQTEINFWHRNLMQFVVIVIVYQDSRPRKHLSEGFQARGGARRETNKWRVGARVKRTCVRVGARVKRTCVRVGARVKRTCVRVGARVKRTCVRVGARVKRTCGASGCSSETYVCASGCSSETYVCASGCPSETYVCASGASEFVSMIQWVCMM